MTPATASTEQLITLNQIAETLNRSVDVQGALSSALARLVELMDLETGWIFVRDPAAQEAWSGRGYRLAAHCNLPPALNLDDPRAWGTGCDCQALCRKKQLLNAYNEVRCSRLHQAAGDRRGLAVHASAPLRVDGRNLGILNVAGPDWESFSEPALALLTNVGSQMGAALERARLFDLLQERHIHQQATLLELSNQLLSRLELDDLLAYLTAEVRRLLQADACAILLRDEPDAGQLAFQAASGWQVDPVANGRRVPTDQRSLAGQALQSQQIFQIEDIQADAGLPWRPDWLQAEGFRGHAAIPLVAAGCSVGVVVLDIRRPRLLDDEELRFLRLMANQAAIAIEKARLHREELKQQQVERELTLAHQIQRSLLPDCCPSMPGWEFAASYQAAQQVGGDFYDYFELPEPPGRWGFVIGDATGKGIPAALQMALSRTVIRTTALGGPGTPSEVLCRANELILKDSYAQRFVSAFYAQLDPVSGRFIYSNAGHHRPLLVRATGEVQELATPGTVLGVFDSAKIGQAEGELLPGDVVVLYTDGVTEMMNAGREMFGEARLGKTVAAHRTASAAHLLQMMIRAVEEFAGEILPADDLTLFVIKRKLHEE